MEIPTFDDDLLDLSDFADRLEKFIEVEHHFVQGGLVLALNSKYGSGKSTFLRMWKNRLEKRDNKPMVISLNAWESDYYGDPLFAIISSLIESLNQNNKDAQRIIDAAKDLGWFATAIGGQIAAQITGINFEAAGDFAEKKREQRESKEETSETHSDTFSVYESRKHAMSNLKEAIEEHVGSTEPRTIFLVDELDRCRPDYAISYLETIKHIFDVQGAVFILAADRDHLENSAKTAFGRDLDFDEYIRKIVHREIALPTLVEANYQKIASEYVKYYLERNDLRFTRLKKNTSQYKRIHELAHLFNLTPRQIQEMFRLIGHVFNAQSENEHPLFWCLEIRTFFMVAMKIGRREDYFNFGHQNYSAIETYDFLKIVLRNKDTKWWFMLLMTGEAFKIASHGECFKILVEVGLASQEEEKFYSERLDKFAQGWGFSNHGRFKQIFETIEQISCWN
ncbi:KAP family P-loop NTPase fold protein [Polystyrenella longa]|uniref:KAP family P-loop NTPase fold protein n=1 Tax=Polystyrenella longa TaxID=2528007 RepID=UPI0018D263E2|nr:P-loop NTPase fold protein [Polystyrenella longa]